MFHYKTTILFLLIQVVFLDLNSQILSMLPGHQHLYTLSDFDFGGREPGAATEFLEILKSAPQNANQIVNLIKITSNPGDTIYVHLNHDPTRNVYTEVLRWIPFWHNIKDSTYFIYDSQSRMIEYFNRFSAQNGPFVDESGMHYIYDSSGNVASAIERLNPWIDSLADRKKDFFYTSNRLDSSKINVISGIPMSTVKYYYTGSNIDSMINISEYSISDRYSSYFYYNSNNKMIRDSTLIQWNNGRWWISSNFYYDNQLRFDSSYVTVIDTLFTMSATVSSLKVNYDNNSNYDSFEIMTTTGSNSLVQKYFFEYTTNPFGVDEVFSKKFKVYPSPTRTVIKVDSNNLIETVRLKIFSTTGIEVTSQVTFPGENSIDLSNLPDGIYFLLYSDSYISICEKVIKQS